MQRTQPVWYLFDYGLVISRAPEPEDWQEFRELSGIELEPAQSPYWRFRPAYDAGSLDLPGYWAAVLGRDPAPELLERLQQLDLRSWSHLNPATEAVLEALTAAGERLALLSNMPAAMAEYYTAQSSWPSHFEKLFFSAHLGLMKPDPQIYRYALNELEVAPEQVVFIDDRQVNLDAAAELGLATVLHAPGIDLAAELGLAPRLFGGS